MVDIYVEEQSASWLLKIVTERFPQLT